MENRVDVASLSDAGLLDEQRDIAARRRALDVRAALVAGEIERRSARALGTTGSRSAWGICPRLTSSSL